MTDKRLSGRLTAEQLRVAFAHLEALPGMPGAIHVLRVHVANQESEVQRLTDAIATLEAELAAYKKAKAENDERFQIERDEARQEAARYRAALEDIVARYPDSKGYMMAARARAALEALKPEGRES